MDVSEKSIYAPFDTGDIGDTIADKFRSYLVDISSREMDLDMFVESFGRELSELAGQPDDDIQSVAEADKPVNDP